MKFEPYKPAPSDKWLDHTKFYILEHKPCGGAKVDTKTSFDSLAACRAAIADLVDSELCATHNTGATN